MKQFKKKELKDFIENGIAQDITELSTEQIYNLKANHDLDKIGYCHGINGISGGLLMDEARKLYAVTKRNSTLFILF